MKGLCTNYHSVSTLYQRPNIAEQQYWEVNFTVTPITEKNFNLFLFADTSTRLGKKKSFPVKL